MTLMYRALTIGAVTCLAGVAMGQSLSNIPVGVTGGIYFPSTGPIKQVFGDQIYTLGVGLAPFGRPGTGKITPSFSIIGADKNGSNFLLIPVTLGYEYNFTDDPDAMAVPYARLEAGVSYYNYNVTWSSGHAHSTEFGYVADVQLGVELVKKVRLTASYYLFEQESGLNFNGFQLSATVQVFKI